MPLKSRGTAMRAERAAQQSEAPADDADVKITPRRGAPEREEPLQDEPFDTGAADETAAADTDADAAAADQASDDPNDGAGSTPAAARTEPPTDAPKPARKRRADAGTKRPVTKKAVAPKVAADATPGSIKSRQREIEVEHKELLRAQKEELKALEAKHTEARNALMREHAALAAQLTKTLFKA